MPDLEPLAHSPASFWAVDLHVHTPASRDVRVDKYGATTPEEIVSAATRAGLDAIAITDHNTVDWCERVAQAAVGHGLIVLPGVEISTPDGHLLGVWDTGTDLDAIRDVLVGLGIARSSQGRLDVATRPDMAGAAKAIAAADGLAVAAHADREKGLLKVAVKAHMQRTLLDPALAAVEVADLASAEQIQAHVGAERDLAVIQSSDVMLPGQSAHVLAGIGARRTWIKAARPDLRGLRHAFEDPGLRVRTSQPSSPSHKIIRSVTVNGGFLGGHTFEFSPDLNCLVGGTGAGEVTSGRDHPVRARPADQPGGLRPDPSRGRLPAGEGAPEEQHCRGGR